MFAGRKSEQRKLEELYDLKESKLVVLYGRAGIGKTELIRQFLQEKDAFYYQVSSCTKIQQLRMLTLQAQTAMQYQLPNNSEYVDLNTLLTAYGQHCCEKQIKPLVIFDEFMQLLENEADITDIIKDLMENQAYENGAMIVLISSSIRWIENDMVGEQPMLSRLISHFMKLKELSFADAVSMLPGMGIEDCISLYACFGGVPAYLRRCVSTESVRQNIMRLIVHRDSQLKNEAENLLKSELRELSSYNAILTCLAAGKHKMNEIYQYTGFSRAKISVYLKSLICIGVVEKMFSFDTKKQEQVKKGLYRICDPFLQYWYHFIFPYQSLITMWGAEKFYDSVVQMQISDYMENCFPRVCMEYMKVLRYHHKLPFEFTSCKSWYGKEGKIDIVAGNDSRHYLAAQCLWSEQPMQAVVLKRLHELCSKAGIKTTALYLFSKSGFTEELYLQAKKEKNVVLIPLNEM